MSGGQPSDWSVYYAFGVAGALAFFIPLALYLVSRTLSKRTETDSETDAFAESENPAQAGRKSNPRIFQALNAAVILILLALLMVPCAVTLPEKSGLFCVLSLSVLAGLALLYGVRKKDLDWREEL